MIFKLQSKAHFVDKETGSSVAPGEYISTKDVGRARDIVARNLGDLAEIARQETPSTDKKKIYIIHDYLAKIGGIETALFYLAKNFKKYNLTFVFSKADFDNALRIGQYADVIFDNGKLEIEADVVIAASFNALPPFRGRIKARKIYQFCHADWKELKKFPTFRNYEWKIEPVVDKVIAVSETAQESLKTAFKEPIESEVIYNVPPKAENDTVVFLTLSRLSPEKGGKRIVELARRFHEAGKKFFWLIATNGSDSVNIKRELRNYPEVAFIEPSPERTGLIRIADYVVQLSDCESSCYTLHEALANGKAFLGTKIPEFEKHIKDGQNGYLLNLDLSNLDIKKIFKEIPRPKPIKEKIDPKWDLLLKGEL